MLAGQRFSSKTVSFADLLTGSEYKTSRFYAPNDGCLFIGQLVSAANAKLISLKKHAHTTHTRGKLAWGWEWEWE